MRIPGVDCFAFCEVNDRLVFCGCSTSAFWGCILCQVLATSRVNKLYTCLAGSAQRSRKHFCLAAPAWRNSEISVDAFYEGAEFRIRRHPLRAGPLL